MNKSLAVAVILSLCGSFVLAAERSEFAVSKQMVISDSAQLENRSLIQFDLDSVIRGKDIDYAAIDLQFEPAENGAPDYLVMIHPVKRAWTDATSWGVNKLGRPGTDYIEEITIPVVVSASNNYRARVVLTPIVKLWADGSIENLGLILMSPKKGANRAKLATESKQGSVGSKLEIFSARK